MKRLRKSIRSNQRQFLGNLEKLRGKTEMHLKIVVEDCCTSALDRLQPAEGVGREYLSNLRENAARTRERQTTGARRQLPDASAVPAAG